jgi:uncharacterized protein (TIGR03435 family)
MRDEQGRFVHLTDPKQIEIALNAGDEGKYYWTCGPKLTPSKDDEKPVLAVNGTPAVPSGDRVVFGRKASMAKLALVLGLQGVTDRSVLDRTGLSGEFTFEAKFALADNAFGNTSSPSIFTALREQLGLKLEAANAPLVAVADRAC